MRSFKQHLQEKFKYYSKLKNIYDNKKNVETHGRLEIKYSNNCIQYIHVTRDPETNKKVTKYIPKSNTELIHKLSQKTYDNRIGKLINKRYKQLYNILKDYEDNEVDEVFEKLNSNRSEFVNPIVPTSEQMLDEWKNIPYNGKEFSPYDLEIYTNKGERVRSKSEKIVADKLNKFDIPYKYESPVKIGNSTFYIDFTILDTIDNKVIYWEHFGMMENPDYVLNFINKINYYQLNGIELGKNLIVTFESKRKSIDEAVINNIINKYLILPSNNG